MKLPNPLLNRILLLVPIANAAPGKTESEIALSISWSTFVKSRGLSILVEQDNMNDRINSEKGKNTLMFFILVI